MKLSSWLLLFEKINIGVLFSRSLYRNTTKVIIFISFDEFTPNIKNPQFRDCAVEFHIICHSDYWDLGNYRERPIKIVGLIDGILENSRLTGIGTFQMVRCDQQILSSTLSGYSLVYRAIHGSDDELPESDKIV